ncbi:hypothetical protein H6G52_10140 [Limnothrix sp. FACHB-881]|uniref:hypothetical protein n=1 Tax=Limnothrix sp. FACHB-881 TaxID=2692819 RepID=UPI0016821CF6|nr:hypothetical protein [Limnothrix sp. FACHB-881]MBD2635718.1 hypothetical protein [Limnothrix sp. FACHB-881]
MGLRTLAANAIAHGDRTRPRSGRSRELPVRARRSPQGPALSIDPHNAGEPPAEFLGRSPSRI